jgi:hypothetical protein
MRTRCITVAAATLAALLLATCPAARAAEALPALAADSGAITVSGVSSGGYMAVQFQVAHAAIVRGAGVLAAGPYYCARGSAWRATRNCMAPTIGSPPPDLAQQNADLEREAGAGRIDAPAALREDRVWLLSGGQDRTVERPVVDALAAFYGHWLAPGALRYVKPDDAGHAMLSAVDANANACATSAMPYINRCPAPGGGFIDAPGELLAHLLGAPGAAPAQAGALVEFDQRPFIAGRPDDASLAASGFVYVPAACREERCRVHVAFHGCQQGAAKIGRRFVEGAGYNAWADRHRLIVLYPQAAARNGFAFGSWRWVYNPKGCWDWWGYTGPDYATRQGAQIKAVKAMLDRLGEPRGR